VGRERELQSLASALAEAKAGRGRLLALVGEPGIGKTRTIEEFQRVAELPDARVLWGRCPEHEGAPAYWPWMQVLREYVQRWPGADLAELLGTAAGDLARLVPEIAARLADVPPPPTLDPEPSRFRLFDGVATFFRRATEQEPLVLVLDDLHWADQASLLLLGFLAPEIRRTRLLIVVTYRDIEMRRLARHFTEVARASERITLPGLRPDQVVDFVHRNVAVMPSDGLVTNLYRVTEGNPFFLGEVVRMLTASGKLGVEDLDEDAIEIPDEVREVIRRRVEPLGAEGRRLLVMAATLGREFELRVLQAASAFPPERVLDELAAAAAAGLIREVAGSAGRFRFSHALVRETLYGDLGPVERAELHRHVALAIETLHAGSGEAPVAALARHFFHAAPLGDAGKAVDYALLAGERALALLGYEEAVRHYERGLEALALQPSEEPTRMRLLFALGDAAWRAGDAIKARDNFERAAQSARALGSAEALARAAVGFGRVSSETGAVDHALVGLLEEALRGLDEGDSALRAALLARLAMALYFSREEERRAALSEQAVAMARRVGDPSALVFALITRHFVLWGPGSVSERLAVTDEALRVAVQLPDRQPAFEIQRWRILDLQELGDMPAADAELDGYARRADEIRLPTYRWHAAVVRTMRLLLVGHFAQAARMAAEAMAMRQHGYGSQSGQCYLIQVFVVYREQGRLAELDPAFTALARWYPALPVWRCGLALLRAERGRPDWARALVAPFAAEGFAGLPRDGNFIPALTLLAELAHALEETRWAEPLYALLLPHVDRHVIVGPSAACYGSAARYLGLLAATLGHVEEAREHFEHALEMNARVGARALEAYTCYDYARFLLAHETVMPSRAVSELLDVARRAAEEFDMPRLREKLAALEATGKAGAASEPPREVAATIRKTGDYWVMTFGTDSLRLKDSKGLVYLSTLLLNPDREFHALDLATGGASDAGAVAVRRDHEADLVPGGLGDAGDLLDAEARAAYKARLGELREELEEAESFNDPGRAARAQEEIEILTRELSRAVGLGGRSRKAGSVPERARLNVTRAIGAVVRKVESEHPALAEHLNATVRTGTFCSYKPDPRLRVRWEG
jgi:predicted ATPase